MFLYALFLASLSPLLCYLIPVSLLSVKISYITLVIIIKCIIVQFPIVNKTTMITITTI